MPPARKMGSFRKTTLFKALVVRPSQSGALRRPRRSSAPYRPAGRPCRGTGLDDASHPRPGVDTLARYRSNRRRTANALCDQHRPLALSGCRLAQPIHQGLVTTWLVAITGLTSYLLPLTSYLLPIVRYNGVIP